MDDLVRLEERPTAKEKYMIAGWHQWADAGAISSGLPQYLIDHTGARRIGEIGPDGFYLFQVPGTHDLLRPVIAFDDGYREKLDTRRTGTSTRQNEFFYTGGEQKGLVIFIGEEPHRNVERYAQAFFDAAKQLGVKRIVSLGGVHAPVPYDKDRQISCVYSLPGIRAELDKYAIRFSNYEGGSSIGTYLVHRAEPMGVEFAAFYALVPFYDFMQLAVRFTGIQLEDDHKAWYDLMRRFNHLFGLSVDLADLEAKSRQLVAIIDAQIDELDQKMPDLDIREQIEQLTEDFEELSFAPLSDVWRRELGDLFDRPA